MLEILDLESRGIAIHVAKTKALISFAVTAKLSCASVLLIQIVGFPIRRLNYRLSCFMQCWFPSVEWEKDDVVLEQHLVLQQISLNLCHTMPALFYQ